MATSATIPNSDIVFRRDGVGDRAIVFMHGWIDDLHVWGPVIAELSGSGFETVQSELAGFGAPHAGERAVHVRPVRRRPVGRHRRGGQAVHPRRPQHGATRRRTRRRGAPRTRVGPGAAGTDSDGRSPVARRRHRELPRAGRSGRAGYSGHAPAGGTVGSRSRVGANRRGSREGASRGRAGHSGSMEQRPPR